MSRTVSEKIWERHVVRRSPGEPDLLYIDLHLVHEVTSPQAFEGLRLLKRRVRRPDLTLATMDHNVPTNDEPPEPISAKQIEAMASNAREFGIRCFPMGSVEQGIVHVISPQLGLTQPGMTIVCGDSHTSTHGALGALAWGIGTSEIEHVLATQTLAQTRPGTMAVTVDGALPPDCAAKDVILAIISRIGTAGGTGKVIEYRGSTIRALAVEGRLTISNMSIEAGARAGIVGPDDVTFAWLEGRPYAPKGPLWEKALDPYVTWGTNPAQSVTIEERVPDPDALPGDARESARRALAYQDLRPGTPVRDIEVDAVFIGSCANARLDDLRAAAAVLQGRHVKAGVRALAVPGSMRVKADAERMGLDRVFIDAGFEWRDAGCSMCLGMNPDILRPGERCASTSNRNFEGRQGPGGRTHLVSPTVAAATAVAGHFALPSDL